MAATRTLFLLRHAKSSWNNPHLDDHERPLNRRGLRDAPLMGKYMAGLNNQPELILASSAVRAFQTAKIVAAELGYALDNIRIKDSIYEAHPTQLLEIIQRIQTSVSSTLLVGHNPGITAITNALSGGKIDNIPTCGLCCIQFQSDDWSSITPRSGELLNFDYPKKLFPPESGEAAESSSSSCSS